MNCHYISLNATRTSRLQDYTTIALTISFSDKFLEFLISISSPLDRRPGWRHCWAADSGGVAGKYPDMTVGDICREIKQHKLSNTGRPDQTEQTIQGLLMPTIFR